MGGDGMADFFLKFSFFLLENWAGDAIWQNSCVFRQLFSTLDVSFLCLRKYMHKYLCAAINSNLGKQTRCKSNISATKTCASPYTGQTSSLHWIGIEVFCVDRKQIFLQLWLPNIFFLGGGGSRNFLSRLGGSK